MKILVVDDEVSILQLIKMNLEIEGHVPITAENALDALELVIKEKPDIIILDAMLPDISGFNLIPKIKNIDDIPIIMLTAKSDINDKLLGLQLGADDYITKPFNTLELIARVKSQLRRYTVLGNYGGKNEENNSIIRSGGLSLNQDTKEVIVDGEVIKLTATELGILKLLLKNQGKVFSIDEIYENVWNEPSYNVENTVAVHIRRIREKIEINPKEPKYLKVVWGIGYKIEKY